MIPERKTIDLSDRGLFESVKNDDQSAFKELYKRYWSKLFIYGYNIIKDKNTCEDIIHEIFYDLWIRRKDLNIENVSAYFYKAVKFQMLKRLRQKRVYDIHSGQFDNFITDQKIEESVEYKELQFNIGKIVNQLPDQRRVIFLLSRKDNLSNKEIAKKLNLSVQTVKNQISSAIKAIRNSIKI
jgi:RNA polymerase sigma-70 factor (family 1)